MNQIAKGAMGDGTYNVVRFKVKSGQEKTFIDAQQMPDPDMPGFKGGGMIKTDERNYCLVGD